MSIDFDTCPTTGRHVDDCGACNGSYCETHGAQPCDCDSAERHTITWNPIGPQRATPSSVAKIEAESRQCKGRLSCSSCVSEEGCLDKYVNRMKAERAEEPVA